MIVEQISVFVENKEGRLLEIAEVLANNNIDISALSLADTDEYGVLRMIVSDPYKAKDALLAQGIIGKVTNVLAVSISDEPGGFATSLKNITDSGISIKYMYACVSHKKGKALMILSVSDIKKAEEIVSSNKDDVAPTEIYRLEGKK